MLLLLKALLLLSGSDIQILGIDFTQRIKNRQSRNNIRFNKIDKNHRTQRQRSNLPGSTQISLSHHNHYYHQTLLNHTCLLSPSLQVFLKTYQNYFSRHSTYGSPNYVPILLHKSILKQCILIPDLYLH